MDKNAKEFKRLRKKLKLSQSQLALRLDCHIMGISMKERGVTPVSKIDLMALKYLLTNIACEK